MMAKELIAAWTAPGHSYPPYINLSADGDDVVVIVRGDPEPVEGQSYSREGKTATMRLPKAALIDALTILQAPLSAGVINGERCTVHGPIARYSEKCGACVSGEGGR